jgi:hypothetical protein
VRGITVKALHEEERLQIRQRTSSILPSDVRT